MTPSSVSVSSEELALWRTFIGRSETRRQVLDRDSLCRFAAAVGAELDVERHAPPLAHWAYFLECADAAGLGVDGHPRRGSGIIPPVTLAHRMFAASLIKARAPLSLGREAQLTLTVADVTHKAGKSGDLILIEVDRCLSQEGTVRIEERQTLVYRGAQHPIASVSCDADRTDVGGVTWTPTPVDLFRFSAVTFNAHRIHYDLPYAQAEEGYPALVVHGPLTAARLFAVARDVTAPREAPHTFRFRALAPLFVGQPILLRQTGAARQADAIRCDGTVAMSAQWSALDSP